MPPPHATKSVTSRTLWRSGKNPPTRTLRPLTRSAFAPIGSAIAAPATSVSAARRHRLAFVTLIVAAPFPSVALVVRGLLGFKHASPTTKGRVDRLRTAAKQGLLQFGARTPN